MTAINEPTPAEGAPDTIDWIAYLRTREQSSKDTAEKILSHYLAEMAAEVGLEVCPTQFMLWWLGYWVTKLMVMEARESERGERMKVASNLHTLFERTGRMADMGAFNASKVANGEQIAEHFNSVRDQAMDDLLHRPLFTAFVSEDLTYGNLIPKPLDVEPVC